MSVERERSDAPTPQQPKVPTSSILTYSARDPVTVGRDPAKVMGYSNNMVYFELDYIHVTNI